jgi:hypothetical protein
VSQVFHFRLLADYCFGLFYNLRLDSVYQMIPDTDGSISGDKQDGHADEQANDEITVAPLQLITTRN